MNDGVTSCKVVNRPEEAPCQAKGQRAKAIAPLLKECDGWAEGHNPKGRSVFANYWRAESTGGPLRLPAQEQAKEGTYILDRPRPGDSIHPIDYRSLFDLLYFKKAEKGDWIPIKSSNRLAPPVDYVCPNCNELIHSDVTGSMRCTFCGGTARPFKHRWNGENAVEYTAEKRRTADLNRFIAAVKY